ncbi:restriction endonuclease subunit S [Mycobacterium senriense]|uniref:Type I restriction modification DNA specificity domain-containing protein n=1 Tax=Mycobacterium senriense TaxID=2775496 RepID=A0ABM7STL5_9MYCO|nr:restriction endonuclease subunit S [Mycobacterium senriense]BCZ24743.1 hypothetical protein MTY59_45980 [Mycobacterium senriense]
MTAALRRVGDVLQHERIPVDPDPQIEYVKIGIRSFGKGIFHYEPTPGDQLGSLRFFALRPNRLVISNIKGWEGAIAVSTEADAHCVASNRFLSYTPIDAQIDVSWARWYFLSEPGIEQIRRASPGSADRNRTLAIDRFESLEIPLPAIDVQRRIAAHLDAVQRRGAHIVDLAARATALTEAAVVSLMSRPDLSASQKAHAGWRKMQLGELLTLDVHEVAVKPTASYNIAGVYSFGRGVFSRGCIEGNQTSYKTLNQISAGQIVMSRLKAWEGAIAAVPAAMNGFYVSPEFPTFTVHDNAVERDFVGLVVSTEPFWAQLKGASKGIGARRERVNAAKLLEREIEVPPLDEQRAVLRSIASLDAIKTARENRSPRLSALLPALLNTAFGP